MKLTKEQVLSNLDEVKKFIQEAEQEKKEEKVVGIAIKNRWTGSIIFQSTKTTYRDAVLERLESGVNLSCANLSCADLSCANLSGAELNKALFFGRGGTKELKKSQVETFLLALGFVVVK